MSKPGRSDIVPGVAAAALLFLCCGAPLLILGLVTAVASAGLIAQGAVLIGAAGLGLAAAFGVRYALRRSARGRSEQRCAECGDRGGRHQHQRHPVSPSA